uniref:Uncharacterized protein n=1 Tax=uncultured Nocardioidaceae bacterium TaxID=253824 RepID=A0A6J4KTU8_9ACTN|nr:MAG: hypothetical protein AVDCRST_MAG46-358 [uncultured Nocardioidaceae bacterium]
MLVPRTHEPDVVNVPGGSIHVADNGHYVN